jgi:hypothetical protein
MDMTKTTLQPSPAIAATQRSHCRRVQASASEGADVIGFPVHRMKATRRPRAAGQQSACIIPFQSKGSRNMAARVQFTRDVVTDALSSPGDGAPIACVAFFLSLRGVHRVITGVEPEYAQIFGQDIDDVALLLRRHASKIRDTEKGARDA